MTDAAAIHSPRSLLAALAGVALASLAVNILAAGIIGLPRPAVHDEFGYLLTADTFAHGRLTNPPHPLWQHFEAMHILQQPTYQSKFPPGPSLFMALGQVTTGYPIVGVWLATALACAALTWALLAFFPRCWALAGGLLVAGHSLVLHWSQSYWGGSVPLLGGALVLGAMQRIILHRRSRDAAIFGLGAAILAISRPYEGFLLTALALARLGVWAIAQRPGWRTCTLRLALPMAATLLPLLAGLGWYNYRVTGSAATLPWAAYMRQYMIAPLFVWQHPTRSLTYRHEPMRQFHAQWEVQGAAGQDTLRGFLAHAADKLGDLAGGYRLREEQGVLLLACLIWALGRNSSIRPVAVMLLLFTLALLFTNWVQPHYAAPAFALLATLLVAGARALADRPWRWGQLRLGPALLGIILMVMAGNLAKSALDLRRKANKPDAWVQQRASIIQRINQRGGRSLVIVSYLPGYDLHKEWVYNAADIDASPIVWARSISPESDRQLVGYYKDRRVWRLDVAKTVTLTN